MSYLWVNTIYTHLQKPNKYTDQVDVLFSAKGNNFLEYNSSSYESVEKFITSFFYLLSSFCNGIFVVVPVENKVKKERV